MGTGAEFGVLAAQSSGWHRYQRRRRPTFADVPAAGIPSVRLVRKSSQPVSVRLSLQRPVTERGTQMRGDGDRRGAGGLPVSRRVLLAAGGAVLLSSTAAAMAADYDARAHSAGTQLRPAADGAAGRAGVRASPPSRCRPAARPGPARPVPSPPRRPGTRS